MLAGEKQVVLVPPGDAHLLEMYPLAHPRARQARLHFGARGMELRPDDPVGNATAWTWPAGVRFFETTLRPGEAVYIPAGWSHHLTALRPAVSFAMTTLPKEHFDFNTWMQGGSLNIMPFMAKGGEWTTSRLAATLRVFMPAVLKALGFGKDGRFGFDPLQVMKDVSYGEAVRRETGMPLDVDYPRCGKPTAADRKLALEAAADVVARFQQYDEALIGLYIMPYLENTISRVAGSASGVVNILGFTVGYVEKCLLRKGARKEEL